ncbi:MAG TPA: hypothetical protein VLH39_00610, partial [Magnetospirillaceae bacterium]|nr:hypothetical protein [Magnetospirillaceae bacterium]
PSLPGLWIDCGIDPVWEIHAFWADGEVDVARPGASATLSLPRDRTCAVLAWPVQGGRRLRPAGAVYPRDGSVTLSLSWEGGYRAEAARVLIRAGMDPARFDLERLVREARVRLGDPWLKPPETFAGRFARGEFRADWLDPPPLYAAAVSGFPGPAASESPFGTCLVPDGEGRAEATLPAGFHAWHAFWGRASADVREDGGSAWVVVRRK